ncbi:MAG: 2-C-methyl-D-erythritol 2,4-cyclodiphosphate synthase [bacterium]
MRVGLGFDVHPLVSGRKLILGGVEIPHALGLLGHSDADVLIHALCDALLGALGEGDIGEHFPDTDARYKDIPSTRLLQSVLALMRSRKYRIMNCDLVIIANHPRLSPYKEDIKKSLARELGVTEFQVNIKASTTNGLPLWGSQEGIAAYSVVLLEEYLEKEP